MSAHVPTPENCPVCGADVPHGAKACPGCGADERAGWNEDATRYDGLDLPDEAFEDGRRTAPRRPSQPNRLWIVAAIVTLVAVILVFVLR